MKNLALNIEIGALEMEYDDLLSRYGSYGNNTSTTTIYVPWNVYDKMNRIAERISELKSKCK